MRKARIERRTKETDVIVDVNLDGKGNYKINTGIPFFDHMLSLLGRHGLLDLKIKASGDLKVDMHHLVEDVGISFGKALNEALGKKEGIRRYNASLIPMDESLCLACVDISGRGYLVFNVPFKKRVKSGFDLELTEEFFRALAYNGAITLHINIIYGKNPHHIIESVFKSVGHAIGESIQIDKRIKGVLSTKGRL
ncbi:imidazoleglycerol-phosphate dehydratase [Candidatus Desantisbacteria bacterium CG1_02_38_46]|uniref:Imidazoleglycerol-phosphate dehydratase n=2 Tax=unclassified Candidatus Desantisiibacteriota TaxID=3106372 RepID=A0A1J4SDU1_9BACT|nr:MAG: imidazoleglycerol-phosphate dehydratase [Candidatus Desantisbacteria bacterium CG1_02_38_46]PIU51789.1 MAG: imidazoleglycerol-phosphate dehydratase HisB [Candidatus Desantisbacteria bacterium CG07_land_8_20_14_0_80_39_15]